MLEMKRKPVVAIRADRRNELVLKSENAVYCLVNIKTGDFYIGSSMNTRNMMSQHFGGSRAEKRKHLPYYAAISEYGAKNFRIEILCYASTNKGRLAMEQFYINLYRPTYNVYTKVTGGTDKAGRKISEHNKELKGFGVEGKAATYKAVVRSCSYGDIEFKSTSDAAAELIQEGVARAKTLHGAVGAITKAAERSKIGECNVYAGYSWSYVD